MMTTRPEARMPDRGSTPVSLMARLAGRSAMTPAWRRTIDTVLGALIAGLLLATLAALARAHRIEAATQRIALDTASPAAARAEIAAVEAAVGQPGVAATLAALAARLPPDILLVSAARGRDGALRIMLDADDPDAVRARLKGDPWLARFRDRGEDQRGDGRLRITLVEGAG